MARHVYFRKQRERAIDVRGDPRKQHQEGSETLPERCIRLSCILILGLTTNATAADIESIAECAREKQQAQMVGIQ